MFRVGLGWDIHRLVPLRPFLLGGVTIPADRGEWGNSDGDVLAHAVIDALLGAAALGDIGEFFPPDAPEWRDADSLGLLAAAYAAVRAQGWRLVNVDCLVICETPKILPWREAIRASLAKTLALDPGAIMVKGKTYEGMGSVGEGLAVEAQAVALLEQAGTPDGR